MSTDLDPTTKTKTGSMAGKNLVSDQGLRLDGRRAGELRRIQCKLGVFSQPDGSAYLEQGNTKVLAAVYGPHQVRPLSTLQPLPTL